MREDPRYLLEVKEIHKGAPNDASLTKNKNEQFRGRQREKGREEGRREGKRREEKASIVPHQDLL